MSDESADATSQEHPAWKKRSLFTPQLDASALVHGDPDVLVPRMECPSAPEDKVAALVYRLSLPRHRHADAATRRQLLTVDAARWSADELARELAAVPVDGAPADSWTVRWATGARHTPNVRMWLDVAGPQATAVMDDRYVLVTLDGTTLHVHDLESGARVSQVELVSEEYFEALAVVESDGRWIAVTGTECVDRCDEGEEGLCVSGQGGLVQRWDLADGTPIGEPLTGHLGSVKALAVARAGGEQVIVSAGTDRTLRMWDLRTGAVFGTPTEAPPEPGGRGEPGAIAALVVGEVDGRPVGVTGAMDGTVLVWDLEHGGVPGPALTSDSPDRCGCTIEHLALGSLGGRPVVVSSGDDRVRVWDLRTGEDTGAGPDDWVTRAALTTSHGYDVLVIAEGGLVSVHEPGRERPNSSFWVMVDTSRVIESVTTVDVRGRPLVLIATYQETFVVDLHPGAPPELRRKRYVGHHQEITALAAGGTASGAYLVTGGSYSDAYVWDPADVTPRRRLEAGGHYRARRGAATVELRGSQAVVACDDDELLVWRLPDGELLHRIALRGAGFGHHPAGVAATEYDGRAVALTAGFDGRVLAWDLEAGGPADRLPPLTGFAGQITDALPLRVGGRRLVVVGDGSPQVQIRDLATGGTAHTLQRRSKVRRLAVLASPVRPLVVAAHVRLLHVWDPATGEYLRTVNEEQTGGLVCEMSAAEIDGRPLLATADTARTIRLWDLATCRQVGTAFTVPEAVNGLALTAEGLAVTLGCDLAFLVPHLDG